jgi:hypothetical protein
MTQVDELAAQLSLTIVTDEFDTEFAGARGARFDSASSEQHAPDPMNTPLLGGCEVLLR